MYLPIYVEPRDVAEANTLMDTFGPEAGIQAAERAVKSRNVAIICIIAAGARSNASSSC